MPSGEALQRRLQGDIAIPGHTVVDMHVRFDLRLDDWPNLPRERHRCPCDSSPRPYSNAFVRSPAFARTPGSGSNPKRRVMNFRIDVVS